MDPISAVSLACNIITFVDFSYKLVSGAFELYRSPSSTTTENARLRNVIGDLKDVTQALPTTVKGGPGGSHAQMLQQLATECAEVAAELCAILEGLKVQEGNHVWRSLEAKWNAMRKEKKVLAIEQKLVGYRLQILLRLSLILSEQQSAVTSQMEQIKKGLLLASPRDSNELGAVQSSIKILLEKVLREELDAVRISDSGVRASLDDITTSLSQLSRQLNQIPKFGCAETVLLRRLCFSSMYARENEIADAGEGTFSWLVDSNQRPEAPHAELEARQSFTSWLKSGNGIYHISGKPGSGKSTLMKYLAHNNTVSDMLRRWAEPKELVFGYSFFWKTGDPIQKSLESLCRAILYTTFKQCPELIRETWPGYSATMAIDQSSDLVPLRLADMKAAMEAAVSRSHHQHRFCFFIDGLDECDGDGTDHWHLATLLKRWAEAPNVKICVSSRPHSEFMDAFDDASRLHLHTLTAGDISRFVSSSFMAVRNVDKIAKADLSDIVKTIVADAEGVFLWVFLVVRLISDGIRHQLSTAALKKKTRNLPRGLEALFDQLFSNIDESDRELSDKMLILAASVKAPINAMVVPWIEDAIDPGFPSQFSMKSLSNIEIADTA